MKKQLPDKKFILATIKITKTREVFKDGRITSFKDKSFHADIRKFGTTLGYYTDTLPELMAIIKKEI